MHYLNYKNSCGRVTCVSEGSPATSVVWMRDGQPLNNSSTGRYSLSQSITDRETSEYTNVLVVARMVAGVYSCTVANDLGSTSEEVTVNDGEFTHNTKIRTEFEKVLLHLCWCKSVSSHPQRLNYTC